MFEPVIAIAASPRDWPRRLYRHVVDHGGARIRGTLLDRHSAVSESFDVLVVDDTTSFLDERLVRDLHLRRQRIVGVYEEAWGRGVLWRLGVDGAIKRDAPADAFLDAAIALTHRVGDLTCSWEGKR